jgi:hypothetical protein
VKGVIGLRGGDVEGVNLLGLGGVFREGLQELEESSLRLDVGWFLKRSLNGFIRTGVARSFSILIGFVHLLIDRNLTVLQGFVYDLLHSRLRIAHALLCVLLAMVGLTASGDVLLA